MTARERHLLACLTEEAGEVSQLVGKCLRFGMEDFHPKTGNVPNQLLLDAELNDLIAVAKMLGFEPSTEQIEKKIKRVEKYIGYAKEKGFYGEVPA